MDRFPEGTGPLFLEDFGISKKASHKSQKIATIPDADLESWMAKYRGQDKMPNLDGALQFAYKLQSPDSDAETGKPGNREQNPPPATTGHSGAPLSLLQEAQEHLKIVASQLAPLYESTTWPLKDIELRTIKQYIQALANTYTELEYYHENHPYSPSGVESSPEDSSANCDGQTPS